MTGKTRELTDYGLRIEADDHREQCQAFNHDGDRCPFVREADSKYCTGCSPNDSLLALDDLGSGDSSLYMASTVKDILRDHFDFPPRDAVVLASGSAISTCYVLEGRLAWAAADGEDSFTVKGHTYSVERGRELLDQVRENLTSDTFVEKWDNACLYVEKGRSRCSCSRKTAVKCGFHRKRDQSDELLRIDEHLNRIGPNPDGGWA